MNTNKKTYRDFIVQEFSKRQRKNPAYSLRAFARDLEIPCSRLSEILNFKRGLSQARAPKLAARLGLTPSEQEYFIDLALVEHGRSSVLKGLAERRILSREATTAQIGEETFSVIADWWHLAIVSYLQLPNVAHTLPAIAAFFRLSEDVVEKALARLKETGFVEEISQDRWSVKVSRGTSYLPSHLEAAKVHQKQLITKALDCVGRSELGISHSASVVQIKKENFPKALEKLRAFRREFLTELEADEGRDSVCCMTMQFFDLSIA
jgi:uncharacterized protein (TIGR02147 family)